MSSTPKAPTDGFSDPLDGDDAWSTWYKGTEVGPGKGDKVHLTTERSGEPPSLSSPQPSNNFSTYHVGNVDDPTDDGKRGGQASNVPTSMNINRGYTDANAVSTPSGSGLHQNADEAYSANSGALKDSKGG